MIETFVNDCEEEDDLLDIIDNLKQEEPTQEDPCFSLSQHIQSENVWDNYSKWD